MALHFAIQKKIVVKVLNVKIYRFVVVHCTIKKCKLKGILIVNIDLEIRFFLETPLIK